MCIFFEYFYPRRIQNIIRNDLSIDINWVFVNIFFYPLFTNEIVNIIEHFTNEILKIKLGLNFTLIKLTEQQFLIQLIIVLLVTDFIQWLIHRILHRFNFLWRFHQIHHSIQTMDWIGNIRFHFFEIIIYKSFSYIPLLLIFEITPNLLLPLAIISTIIGHLNHSNIKINYGPLKYIFNSPEMHIWHHDRKNHFKYGQNFGIIFSAWDFIFKTAYFHNYAPEKLGFEGDEKISTNFIKQIIWPFVRLK